MSEHARFEQLAVGHVVGGLDDDDAADFRDHLIGCRECRLRVAELRAIADDLAAAERDEQQRSRTKLETVRRAADDESGAPGDGPGRTWRRADPRTIVLLTIVLLVGAVTALVWSFHLRTVNAELTALSERQERVMEAFATGRLVPATFAGDTRGRVAVSGGTVAVSFVNVPAPAADERLVLWLVGADGATQVLWRRVIDPEGRLALVVARDGAVELVLSLEPWPGEGPMAEPGGEVLVRADLAAATGSAPDGAEAAAWLSELPRP